MTNTASRDQKPSTRRATVELGRNLENRLRSYAIAARTIATNWDNATLAISAISLTGLVILMPGLADAEVIFTPAHRVLQLHGPGESFFSLDVNNDGQPDFIVYIGQGSSHSSGNLSFNAELAAFGYGSNRVMSNSKGNWQAALPHGEMIGPEKKFDNTAQWMAACQFINFRGGSGGPWRNVTNRYLGLKFVVDGEIHYGWARMTVQTSCGYTVVLTGYAYETVPNKPIRAVANAVENSDMKLPSATSDSTPAATLGALALGYSGLPIWRSKGAETRSTQ